MSPSLQRQELKKKKKTKSVDNQKLPKVAIVTSPSNMASSLQKEKKNVKIVTPGLSESKSEVANKEVKQFEPHIAQEPETKITEHEVKKLESNENNTDAIHLPDVKQVVQSVNADTIDNTTHHMESQNNNNNISSSSNSITASGRKSLLSTSALRPFSASSRGSSAGSKALKNITTNCLKMINYAAIRQGQAKNKNNSSKRQNSIMMNEFLSAHNKGVAMFETEWRNGYERLYEWFRVESYTPHVMQIQKLMRELDFVKEDCTQKLKFAQQSVCNVLHGVQNMISEVRKTGLLVSESTQCLSVNAPFNCEIHLPENKTKCLQNISKEEEEDEEQQIESQANVHNLQRNSVSESNSNSNEDLHKTKFTEKQHDADMWLRVLQMNSSVMNEVRDCNDVSTETHPRIKYVSQEEVNTINRVSRFFSSFIKDDQLYKLTDDEVIALLSLPDTFIAEEGIEHIVHTQRRKRDKEMLRQGHQIKELQFHLQLMTECVVMLLKRLHMHNSQYVHKMSFQQVILDKVASRVKLADNVLDNVKTINANATAFVLDDLRKLSLNLRSRMDHVEQTILSSLGQLIEASSTGILSNLEECSSSNNNNTTTENVSCVAQDASERKENIMRFFCMTMTEMKQEQCDIMRDIYEFITFLWRTQQHCEENLTEETKSQERLEEEKVEMNAPSKEKGTMENEKSEKANNHTINPVCLGRLEKETLRHRSLPTYYTEVLEQWCDRDMLLRLLHHITIHDHNAMSILLSALDEYVHFLSLPTHHAEAEAILERQREFHEVHRLLIKLHEEGMIDDRSARKHTCSPSYSLADKIKDMIEEYNNNKEPCISKNGNSFASHKLFKEIRNSKLCQEDSKEHYLPFFAFTHPPPAEVRAQMETKSINVKCPFNSAFYTHSAQLHDDASADKDKHNDSCHTKQYDKCRCDKVEQLPNRGAVMTYLQQSCASDQFDSRKICCGHASNKAHSSNKSSDIDSTKFYTSVVGDGRWGGMAAIKNDNNMHNSLLRRQHKYKNETALSKQPSLRHLRYGRNLTNVLQAESREYIHINASVNSNNICEYDPNSDVAEKNTRLLKSTNPIVPAAPTRVNLVNRVIKHCSTNIDVSDDKNSIYNQEDETTTNKESGTELPNRSCVANSNRCCSEADLWFIDRQRALAVPFLVRPHDSDSDDDNNINSVHDDKVQT